MENSAPKFGGGSFGGSPAGTVGSGSAGSAGSAGGNITMDNKDKIDEVVKPAVDSAGNALHGTIDKVAGTVERVSGAAHETVDKLADQATQVADKFSDQTRWLSEAPNQALVSSKDWIREKPLEAVGIALAVGYLYGRLKSR